MRPFNDLLHGEGVGLIDEEAYGVALQARCSRVLCSLFLFQVRYGHRVHTGHRYAPQGGGFVFAAFECHRCSFIAMPTGNVVFSMMGTREEPFVKLGMSSPMISTSVGNMSSVSTIAVDVWLAFLLLGSTIIRGERSDSSNKLCLPQMLCSPRFQP